MSYIECLFCSEQILYLVASYCTKGNWWLAQCTGFDSRADQIRNNVAERLATLRFCSELCCLGATPQRWVPLLFTRFGVTALVNDGLILILIMTHKI